MLDYGDTQAQREPDPATAAEQLLGLLLDVTLEPEERRIFLAGAVRFLGISRVGVQGYVEARYGAAEWRRLQGYLSTQPWETAVSAVALMTGDDEQSEEQADEV